MKLLAFLLLFAISAKAQDTTKVKLIICKWQDVINSDSGWHTLEQARDFSDNESSVVTQVGFLLRRDDRYLIMTEAYFEDRATVGTVIRIPVGLIITMREIEIEFIDPKK